MAARLTHSTKHVTTVKIEPALKGLAENNFAAYGIKNAQVLCENVFLSNNMRLTVFLMSLSSLMPAPFSQTFSEFTSLTMAKLSSFMKTILLHKLFYKKILQQNSISSYYLKHL